jgi:hypothetical protein
VEGRFPQSGWQFVAHSLMDGRDFALQIFSLSAGFPCLIFRRDGAR